MKEIFNLSVIGTNFIVPRFIDAAEQSGYFRLHSIMSRKIQSGEDFRKANNFDDDVLVYDSLNDLLNNDEVDVVYIASPNAIHFAQARACMNAGKPVYVEKPISSNADELASLTKLAKTKECLSYGRHEITGLPKFHSADGQSSTGWKNSTMHSDVRKGI